METNDSVRSRLLAQLPHDGELTAYRAEVAALLERRQQALRRGKSIHQAIMIVASGVFVAGEFLVTAHRESFILSAFVIFLYGIYEDARYRTRRGQLELLKEMKQIQLQILELESNLHRKEVE